MECCYRDYSLRYRVSVIRTQIQLTDEQAARVKRIARRRGVSMAAVIRDALDATAEDAEVLRAQAWARFDSAVGAFHGGTANVSEQHDAALADAYEDWR